MCARALARRAAAYDKQHRAIALSLSLSLPASPRDVGLQVRLHLDERAHALGLGVRRLQLRVQAAVDLEERLLVGLRVGERAREGACR